MNIKELNKKHSEIYLEYGTESKEYKEFVNNIYDPYIIKLKLKSEK